MSEKSSDWVEAGGFQGGRVGENLRPVGEVSEQEVGGGAGGAAEGESQGAAGRGEGPHGGAEPGEQVAIFFIDIENPGSLCLSCFLENWEQVIS